MTTIHFYGGAQEYGKFSNFALCPIRLDGEVWPTSEHYFQAQKCANPGRRAVIRKAHSPAQAAELGRDRTSKLRKDWESVKVSVMHKAILAKFSQHDDLRSLLLGTGDAKLVERTENDSHWGDGATCWASS